MNKGLLVVVSAPSGCGKDTVINALRESDFKFEKTISDTTRVMREGETNGVDYTFIDETTFKNRIENGYYLEYTVYNGNFYGTPKSEVEKHLDKGECVLMKIEVEGAGNVRKLMPEAVSVFLVPPSMEELEKRLRGRGTETEESFKKRFETAKQELARAPEYDYIVVNDEISKCVEKIRNIIETEGLRYCAMKNFVDDLLR
ncbi:MAG: guanylate kinase [Ruminococcaceae bacterium]|nr:guanylate kinase [Oscillospiraceae bacterium]